MHEAYEVNQLLKLTVQIESITAYDEILLVGTRQGHLLMYNVVPRASDQKHDVQLMRYNKTFSKKPIQQLEVIPEYNLLVSLTDNVISVHDINSINFPQKCQIQKTRGATLFTLDTKKEISLTEKLTVVIRMCVAVKRKLQIYYWKNNDFHQLVDDIIINDVPRTLTWCQETIFVGFRGEYTLFELSGKSKELFPTSGNKSSEPCITKLSANIMALGRENQSVLVNTDGNAEKTKALRWSDVPTALAWDEPYLLGLLTDVVEIQTIEPSGLIQTLVDLPKARLICHCRRGIVYVASVSQLWCLQAVDIAKQRQHLLNEKQFQLALKLTYISDESDEDKKQKIHQIQTIYAYDLFANKHFSESMKEFFKLETDPYDVIRLFPDLLPQQQNVNADNTADPTGGQMKLQDRDLESGLLALIEFLTEVRHKTQFDTQSKANANASGNLNERGGTSKATTQLLQIIDTTLLKCYLQTNDALVAPLLRRNHCHLGETEKMLKKHHKFSELIILYQTKGQHKKALELLQKQSQQMDSSLRGLDRSIQYLQHLGTEYINLIFEFAGWILDLNPEEGLKIFIEDLQEVENLPRPKVLDYLLRTHKSLVIPYLEHIVQTWKDNNPLFHNALVHQYREKVQQMDKDQPCAQHTQHKLISFLETSTNYTPETVIQHFPASSLFEERAVILGKLGKHEQVLSIYVNILGDVDRAVAYCNKVFSRGDAIGGEVYVMLISMLLTPTLDNLKDTGIDVKLVKLSPKTAQPDLETALALLEKYADKIEPIKALSILPDTVPVSRIQHFLETSLQMVLNKRRKAELLKGLLYAEHLQMQELRMLHESQNILITELNVCPVCKKRFSKQSAFVRYPNGLLTPWFKGEAGHVAGSSP
ncbi:Vacuolar protein sorting 39 [Carabus blaptoides fortunei]